MNTPLCCGKAAAVVVNSGNSNGYGVVLNLGREGVPVFSVDSNPGNVSFRSKYAKDVLSPDPKASEQRYIDFLIELGKSLRPKPVLFVTGDEMVMLILGHRQELEPYYHMPMASLEISRKLLIKREFYEMLEGFGIPHAKTYSASDVGFVKTIYTDLDYPYILKPSRSSNFAARFHNKCLRVDSPDALLERYREVAAEDGEIIIQQELLGTERYLVYTYLDASSKPIAVNCYKKIRIFPIDYGNACVCETVWEPGAVEMTLATLQRMGYHGLAEAEVQRDARDGLLKLVEINARSTTETRLSARCGMNMELLAYRDALGIDMGTIRTFQAGVKWFDLIIDFQSIFFPSGYLSRGRISLPDILRSYRGEREYAFLAWDDPIPFLTMLFRFFRGIIGRVCRRVRSLLFSKRENRSSGAGVGCKPSR